MGQPARAALAPRRDDAAIAAFLDELDVRSPREREMLSEIARKETLARPERFLDDHRRAVAAIESLRRHGFHGTRAGRLHGPLQPLVRWLVELVARYTVVSYVKSAVTSMRNLGARDGSAGSLARAQDAASRTA